MTSAWRSVLSLLVLTILAACARTPAAVRPGAPDLAGGGGGLHASGERLGPAAALGGPLESMSVLSPTRFVAVYRHARKLTVRVGEVTGDAVAFGEPAILADNEDGIDNVWACTVLTLDDSHVVLVHRAESSELRVNVGTVTGRAITLRYGPRNGGPVFDNQNARNLSATALEGQRFLLAYDATDSETGDWRGYLQLGAVEPDGVKSLERKALAPDAKEDTALARLGPSAFVLAVRGFGNDGYFVRVLHGTVANDRLQTGAEQTLPTEAPTNVAVTALGPAKFLLGYKTTHYRPGRPPGESYVSQGHLHVGSVFQNGIVLGPGASYESTSTARVFVGASAAEQLAFAANGEHPQQGSSLRLGQVTENRLKLGAALALPSPYVHGLVRLDDRRLLVAHGGDSGGVVRTAVLPEPPGPRDITVDPSDDLLSLPLGGGRFLVTYADKGHARRGLATLGEVKDGRLLVGAPGEVFSPGLTWDLHGARLSENRFVLAYKEGRTGKVRVGEAHGDKLVLGPAATLANETSPSQLSISVLAPDKLALAYRTSDSPGAVVFGTVAGDRVTLGDRFLFERGDVAVDIASVGLGPGTLAILYGVEDPATGVVRYLARGARTEGADVFLSEPRPLREFVNPRLTSLGGGAFAATFGGPDDSLKVIGQLVLGTFDGQALSLQPPAVVSSRHTEVVAAAALASDQLLVSYTNGESLEKPFTAAFARFVRIHAGTAKPMDEVSLTKDAAPHLTVAPLADGTFVVSYTVGADAGRATTRLGTIQGDGVITWKDGP